MTTPGSADSSTVERDRNEIPGSRRWLDATVLWVAAVGAYALTLFLLAQFQMQQFQAWEMEQLVSALRDGNLELADVLGASPLVFAYPAGLVVKFALVGLAVVALAWTGRRTLAWALPFAMALVSISPAYSSTGPPVPHPLSGGDQGNLWGSLVAQPAMRSYDSLSTWPFFLGVAVQTSLLLLPLVAAPTRRAAVPLASAARRAAIPTAAVAVVALASIDFPSVDELYRVPASVLVLGLVAGAVATGAGSAWLRLPAAVAVPAIIGPIILPDFNSTTSQYVMLSLAVAVGALFVVLGTLATPWMYGRFTALRHGDSTATVSA